MVELSDDLRPKLARPVVRRATAESMAAAAPLVPEDVQRWTSRRRTALVLGILKGDSSVEEEAGRHHLTVGEIEEWKERLLAAAHNALRSKPRDEEAIKDDQIRRLKQKVGELVLEVDMLKEALRGVRAGSLDTSDD